MDAEVIIVGAGPTGLMLAAELGLAGVRVLVLERRPGTPERGPRRPAVSAGRSWSCCATEACWSDSKHGGSGPTPAPRLPFGGMHVDFTPLPVPPMEVMPLPQPQLERLLAELALELGAEIRRGQEVVGLSQDDTGVTADVRGSDGEHRVTAGLPRRLRRRERPGARHGGHPVPRHHLPRGPATRPGGPARVGDRPRERRHRRRRDWQDQLSASREPSAASSPSGRPNPG